MLASAVATLRQEVTAILTVAEPGDRVLVRLESAGGAVHAYGLAASQIARFRERKVPVTVAVDKIAASGGYMMACTAEHIIAAPFAVLGSIGVVAQLPNFHRLLEKNDIDFELFTAGEFKRTITLFGENTDKARAKFREEIEEVHVLFKDFVKQNRPVLDLAQVATGEHWYGSRALELKLVDELRTSDDYLLEASSDADLYEVTYHAKKGLWARILPSMDQDVANRVVPY
jgi:serine protease SohB